MREIGALYVDKTADVWRMVNDSCGRTFFLSRPRRFGKSLLLSTFKAFFQGRRDLFKGLKIDSLAPDEAWQEYPILDMTMTRAADRDPARIESSLIQMVDELASRYGVAIQGVAPRDRFNSLILELVAKTKKPVVILIDEYDKPILDVIGTDALDRTLEIMKSFYQVVKDRNADERFVFITGVTKFAHTSLFSGANNPTDLTSRADFATLLGYTEEELKANFAEEIEATAKAKGVSVEKLLADMKEWYDGFRFEENSPSVYNPVSVGQFFASGGKFNNYWYATGTPSFLVEAAKRCPFDAESFRNVPVASITFDKYDASDIDPFVFMVQTGYLTISRAESFGVTMQYYMDYPNREVRESFERFLLGRYMKKRERDVDTVANSIRRTLGVGDVDAFVSAVKPVFATLPYENIGDPAADPVRFYEGYFRNVMLAMLTVASVDGRAEQQTAAGRIDLVVNFPSCAYVFELKTHDGATTPEAVLDAAMEQAHTKNYAAAYARPDKTVTLVAMSFNRGTRQVSGYRAEPITA